MSVNSTQGKLEVWRRHYEELGVDDNFEADWKEEVLETCSNLPDVNARLDRREELAQCVKT